MLSVLIVDSDIDFRSQLAGLLNSQPDFTVVGQVGSIQDAELIAENFCPSLVLMEFDLPDGDGLQAIRHIKEICPQTVVVCLAGHADEDSMISAIRSGAKGYLLKSLTAPKLLASLRGLRKGQAPISRTMVARLLEEFSRNNHHPETLAAVDLLTPREMDVLLELVKGGSNREIAARLFISEYTVKNHVHSILRKLEVSNRREAVKYVQNSGLKAGS